LAWRERDDAAFLLRPRLLQLRFEVGIWALVGQLVDYAVDDLAFDDAPDFKFARESRLSQAPQPGDGVPHAQTESVLLALHLHWDSCVHFVFELLVDLAPSAHCVCPRLAPKLAQRIEVLQLAPRRRHEVGDGERLLGLGAKALEGRARVILGVGDRLGCRRRVGDLRGAIVRLVAGGPGGARWRDGRRVLERD
jgi:hypothetical protein